MNKSLFAIETEYLRILQEFEDTTEDGILDEATLERLSINKDELVEKLENYRLFIKSVEGDIRDNEEEIERLKNKNKTKENIINSMKMLMKTALQLYGEDTDKGTKRLKLKSFSVWTVKTKPVIIEDADSFDDKRFISYTLTNKIPATVIDKVKDFFNQLELAAFFDKSISKKDIKDALKNDEEIKGAYLDEEITSFNMR